MKRFRNAVSITLMSVDIFSNGRIHSHRRELFETK